MTEPLPTDPAITTANNGAFSRTLPGMQLAIDSTSLGEFKLCPRRYWYSIVRGLQPRAESVHLTFGILLHQGREQYEHMQAAGIGHEEALRAVVRNALAATWLPKLGRGWVSDHPSKNRLTLIRTLVWYLDALGRDDPAETIRLGNGRPAVELTFRFDSGLRTASGEPIEFCGHLDRVARLGDVNYICDIKTTEAALSPSWFSKFTPDNQIGMYTLASRVAFGTPIAGLIIDGIQVGATFARFQRQPIPRTDGHVDEWLADTAWWIGQMEAIALRGHWPMNDKACGMYGGCPFRPVCSRPPGTREAWLATEYRTRVWDPTIRRGDV